LVSQPIVTESHRIVTVNPQTLYRRERSDLLLPFRPLGVIGREKSGLIILDCSLFGGEKDR
jgi:hypothetical protein